MSTEKDDFPILVVEDERPEQVVSHLLEQAVRLGASDLLFAPQEDGLIVQVRHLGVFRLFSSLSREVGHHCIGHIKAMSGMDVVEHRRPLDGRWSHPLEDGSRIDLRVNVLPTLHGEDCSIRLLSRDRRLRKLDSLGLSGGELADLLAMLSCPSGLILVTGPTGTGKTTTLYACLDWLNNGERKINTIEDPVEYELEGVRQSQVNARIELGFPELLRGVLRQAPDVIMVGEVRDPVTAVTVVHAANCGHLVLATAHAPTASAAVQSLRSWGVHPHFLASSLLGVIAQRLVRTLCPDCRSLRGPDDLAYSCGEEGRQVWSARGCPSCHGTGYGARTGVFEVLRLTPPLRRLIAADHPTHALREQAVRDGLVERVRRPCSRSTRGQTTPEEVARTVPHEHLPADDKPPRGAAPPAPDQQPAGAFAATLPSNRAAEGALS
ncbi:MAG: GspE/PulE family protein [Gemmataceae bacterium]